jgi:hypothetical protein
MKELPSLSITHNGIDLVAKIFTAHVYATWLQPVLIGKAVVAVQR